MSMSDPSRSLFCIIEAFDRELWCPVLQLRLKARDKQIQKLLGVAAEDDPSLTDIYTLDLADLARFEQDFGCRFDPLFFDEERFDVSFYAEREPSDVPYLVHTGFELPMLLDGRKPLAQMYHEYPPAAFEGEAAFDRWVDAGLLSKSVKLEPFEKPIKGFEGLRAVFYTPKGEEWRIQAFDLVRQAATAAGGWNAHFERIEGMLYGYEQWQIDWWITNRYGSAATNRKALKRRR